MSYYAKNPHYAPADTSEDDEIAARHEAEAGRWFFDLTKPQRARFNERMAAAAAYKGAPRWERERDAANREWAETTKEAKAVFEMALADLNATGEISEATNYAYNQAAVSAAMREAAE